MRNAWTFHKSDAVFGDHTVDAHGKMWYSPPISTEPEDAGTPFSFPRLIGVGPRSVISAYINDTELVVLHLRSGGNGVRLTVNSRNKERLRTAFLHLNLLSYHDLAVVPIA